MHYNVLRKKQLSMCGSYTSLKFLFILIGRSCQYCGGFRHTSIQISHGLYMCCPTILHPSPTSFPTPSLSLGCPRAPAWTTTYSCSILCGSWKFTRCVFHLVETESLLILKTENRDNYFFSYESMWSQTSVSKLEAPCLLFMGWFLRGSMNGTHWQWTPLICCERMPSASGLSLCSIDHKIEIPILTSKRWDELQSDSFSNQLENTTFVVIYLGMGKSKEL